MAGKQIDRRTMIKGAAVAGVAAWTAPVILDSLTSPAAASSGGGLPTSCSYALVVFKYGAGGPYIMKIEQGSASCSFVNSTSSDTSFDPMYCNWYRWRGGEDYGSKIQYSADYGYHWNVVPGYPTGSCDSMFTVSGTTVTADDANVSIIFATSHYAHSFHNVCPTPGKTVTLQCSRPR